MLIVKLSVVLLAENIENLKHSMYYRQPKLYKFLCVKKKISVTSVPRQLHRDAGASAEVPLHDFHSNY
jgi:hypothetical protein